MKRKILIIAAAAFMISVNAEIATAEVTEAGNQSYLGRLMQKIETYISEHINVETEEVVSLTNEERKKAGLHVLEENQRLNELARLKAEDMAEHRYFSHTSPTYGNAFDMLKKGGIRYSLAGENIAKGQKTAESAVNSWMKSAAHRDNILNDGYTQMGAGYAADERGNTYWVQIFIK